MAELRTAEAGVSIFELASSMGSRFGSVTEVGVLISMCAMGYRFVVGSAAEAGVAIAGKTGTDYHK